RTSSATTAKPRPASPARAASMAALSASRLVCSAMPRITSSTVPICSLLADRPCISPMALVRSRISAWNSSVVRSITPRPTREAAGGPGRPGRFAAHVLGGGAHLLRGGGQHVHLAELALHAVAGLRGQRQRLIGGGPGVAHSPLHLRDDRLQLVQEAVEPAR